MWELDCEESWEPKNWCFWTVVLEKTLESPLDCKEIQPILKEISPGRSLEGMMLKLKLQDFGHLMRRVDSLEKTLMLGRIGGRRKRGQQRMRWLDGITYSMDVRLRELQDMVMDRAAWRAAIHGVTKSQTWLSDWTELNWTEWQLEYRCVFIYPLAHMCHQFIVPCIVQKRPEISIVILWIREIRYIENAWYSIFVTGLLKYNIYKNLHMFSVYN